MAVQAGNMVSVEVGVADEDVARRIESAVMDEASPSPGSERVISEDATLKFLRSFDVEGSSGPTEPSLWVDFVIRYSDAASADVVADWLVSELGDWAEVMSVRVDRTEVDVTEEEAMRKVLRDRMARPS